MFNTGPTSLNWDDIMDMVILIDGTGHILRANKSFYEIIGSHECKKPMRLSNFIYPLDTPLVDKILMEKLLLDDQARGFEFRIVDCKNRIIDVECNAKSVQRGSRLLGYQLVIRDITGRKILEMDHAKAITILGLAKLAEFRDEGTGAHLERIREYSKLLANELCNNPRFKNYISQTYVEDLFQSSTLHDIGKVGIADRILLKPGKLTAEEFNEIKQHTALGGDVLRNIDNKIENQSFLTLGKQIAYYHHEKWNGCGYSKGLKGEEIPLSARIVALADVYDALTSKRSYKDAFTHEKAHSIIVEDSGTHFDPDIVTAFMAREANFNKIRHSMNDMEDEISIA